MRENWIARLIKWIKRLWGWQESPKPRPLIEAEWHTWYGDLYRLYRSTPEATPHATYRFVPAYRKGHLLLTCDRYGPRRDRSRGDRPPGFQGIRNGSPAPGHPDPSHRLSLTQISTSGNLVKARIIFSYPVDFVGPKGIVRIWQAKNNGIITPELLARIDQFTDRSAILITAELAELLTRQYLEEINWEEQIHCKASRLGASHAILLSDSASRSPPS